MPRYDFTSPRLFVSTTLRSGTSVPLDKGQANYLRNVLRLKDGATVLAFDGQSGEWQTALRLSAKAAAALEVTALRRPQPPARDLLCCFAPLKHARLDYMVQKAVEMGAGVLQPVITRRTQVARLNLERVQANVIEAAEQCGILQLPEVRAPLPFAELVSTWPAERLMVFCDEDAPVADPLAALGAHAATRPPLAVLIGPEGGFDPAERRMLAALGSVVPIALGPRILRADTAAVAALAVVQAVLGDWR